MHEIVDKAGFQLNQAKATSLHRILITWLFQLLRNEKENSDQCMRFSRVVNNDYRTALLKFKFYPFTDE